VRAAHKEVALAAAAFAHAQTIGPEQRAIFQSATAIATLLAILTAFVSHSSLRTFAIAR